MQPNILLVMPDQMRGDCLSLEGHPVLMTPNMDEVGGRGTHFTRAYTTCASCIPARRSLLTGMYPSSSGMVGYGEGYPIKEATLPNLLRRNGYRTALVGRYMHQFPAEESYGYETTRLGSTYVPDDEYAVFLEEALPGAGGIRGLGISFNGWQARPWPWSEHLHPSNWTVQRSRELLAEPDEGRPLFLTTSFYAPHPPLIPPDCYYRRYLDMELPPAVIGSWAVSPEDGGIGTGVDAHRTVLRGEALRNAQAGYFGLINHLDDQLYWLLAEFKAASRRAGRPWVVVFTSDHGEMLGDHYLFRKCEPYEGASRIPLLIQASPDLGLLSGNRCGRAVSLEDIMPTLLEMAGIPVPESVDGQSLLPLLAGGGAEDGRILHLEHSPCYDDDQAYHCLTDGRMKYIWRPQNGVEQLFDLESDPGETTDLLPGRDLDKILSSWRKQLVRELQGRPEGFVSDGNLVSGRPYAVALPRLRALFEEPRAGSAG